MELPPVILLRAFDAAGRHGSFKRAAALLHVTPSTISHQIADLEQWLGVQLFVRETRALRLTAEGAALLEDVAAAFERLRAATARLRTGGQPCNVRISATPFFAAEILLPLIGRCEAAFPGLALHVSATDTLLDPRDGAVDFCVRNGAQDAPGLERVPLVPLTVTVLAAPGVQPLAAPRLDYPFHDQSAWWTWQQRGGTLHVGHGPDRHFSSYDAAQRAAAQGLGLTLSMLPLARTWMRTGRLVQVDDLLLPLGTLDVVSRVLTPAQRRLREVRDWLVEAFRSALT